MIVSTTSDEFSRRTARPAVIVWTIYFVAAIVGSVASCLAVVFGYMFAAEMMIPAMLLIGWALLLMLRHNQNGYWLAIAIMFCSVPILYWLSKGTRYHAQTQDVSGHLTTLSGWVDPLPALAWWACVNCVVCVVLTAEAVYMRRRG